MRIAFVSVPRFPCAMEAQRNSRLARRPMIVGDAEQPKRVLDCSSEASRAGVGPGMAIRKALGLCPEAVVVAPDPVLYRSKWEAVLDALDGVTPEIEDEELGRAYLNVGGLEGHYSNETALAAQIIETTKAASGLSASVGMADGKFPAFAAAVAASAGAATVIPAGAEADFLLPLTVELLPIDPEIISRLRLLGLETLGEVAPFSLPELLGQFGFAGKRLWQLVGGIDDEPLRPRRSAETVAAYLGFEAPVAGVDILIAAAKQLLSRLLLPLRGRAARELTLQAELDSGRGWERRQVFREPVSENERLIFLLRSSLSHFPPPQAVRSISLRLGGLTGETGKQIRLGERGRLQRPLEEAIRQLKARYGYSPIYRCVEVEPWSVIPEERQILVESDG